MAVLFPTDVSGLCSNSKASDVRQDVDVAAYFHMRFADHDRQRLAKQIAANFFGAANAFDESIAYSAFGHREHVLELLVFCHELDIIPQKKSSVQATLENS